MLYSVTHVTRHLYHSPVSQSINELRLTPRSLPHPGKPTEGLPGTLAGQQLREINMLIEPEPASWQGRKDYFGNEVTTVALYEPPRRLVIEARSMVELLRRRTRRRLLPSNTSLIRRLSPAVPSWPASRSRASRPAARWWKPSASSRSAFTANFAISRTPPPSRCRY